MGLHPLLSDILERQLRSLRRIRMGMLIFSVAVAAAGFFLPEGANAWVADDVPLASIGLGITAAAMLATSLWVTRRFSDPDRVARAGAEELRGYGLPERLDLGIGRQAVYLTRVSAGWVLGWGMVASVGVLGLLCRWLGSPMWAAALFGAGSIVFLLWFRVPDDEVRIRVGELGGGG
jgi:hypothetical protein